MALRSARRTAFALAAALLALPPSTAGAADPCSGEPDIQALAAGPVTALPWLFEGRPELALAEALMKAPLDEAREFHPNPEDLMQAMVADIGSGRRLLFAFLHGGPQCGQLGCTGWGWLGTRGGAWRPVFEGAVGEGSAVCLAATGGPLPDVLVQAPDGTFGYRFDLATGRYQRFR